MAPIFDYKALAGDGKPAKGTVEADTLKTARQKLKKQGLMVTDITEKTAAKPRLRRQRPLLWRPSQRA